MKVETSLDWQHIYPKLMKLAESTGQHQFDMKKIVGNLESMITELSIEEIECRRKQKQTKKHQELITKINEEITNYEQMITFGTLLNG
jgi:hypothetical protein